MTRAEVLQLLAKAERDDLANARAALDRLRPALQLAWIDHELRRRAHAAAERCKEPIEVPPPASLRVGETWLLLALGGGLGRVARMSALPLRSRVTALPHDETFAALQALAATAVRLGRYIPSDALETRFGLADGETNIIVEGSSLRLSTCVALVSSLTHQPPRMNVAATAAVDRKTGKLLPVSLIEPKCRAIEEQWPEIDTVVVAQSQELRPDPRLHVVRAATIVEALEAFGLDLTKLRPPSPEALRTLLKSFEQRDAEQHDLAQWRAFSEEARQIAELLEADDDAASAAQARVWSALFASHAGHNKQAAAVLETVPENAIDDPSLQVMRDVVQASVRIDDDPRAAATLTETAVARARELPNAGRRQWLGKALGTQGRAILHSGDPARAEAILREAHEHHLGVPQMKAEAPRSACYLACCLRHMGRADEALALLEDARSAAERRAHSDLAKSTLRFIDLERGRALAALDRIDEAVAMLEPLVDPTLPPASYPSLGARRTLAALLRRLGRNGEAHDHLQACWRLAHDASVGETAQKVGAVAAAEDRLTAEREGRAPSLDVAEVNAVWLRLFGDAAMAQVVRSWVY